MWAQLLNVLLGVWLMAAPGVLDYTGRAAGHDWIVGPLIAGFAAVAVWDVTRPVRWVNVVLGAWLLVAPWLLGHPAVAAANSVVAGVALIGLSLAGGPSRQQFDGGWRTLWEPRAAVQAAQAGDAGAETSRGER